VTSIAASPEEQHRPMPGDVFVKEPMTSVGDAHPSGT
jgi:hypothetical protein